MLKDKVMATAGAARGIGRELVPAFEPGFQKLQRSADVFS
jgi:hypothetical protein